MKQSNYCHYGSNCRRNQNGNCPFKHRKDEISNKNKHKSSSKGYHKERERSRSYDREKDRKKHKDHKSRHHQQEKRHQNDYKKQSSKSKYQEKPKYQQKVKQFDSHPQNHYPSKNNSKPYQRGPTYQNTPVLPFQKEFNKFCKSYHLDDMCDDKDNCTKIHGFMFEANDCFRRRIFKKSEKYKKDVKLGFSINDQTINYIVKNQKQVIFYQYTPAYNDFKEISVNTLQQTTKYSKNEYFGCQEATLYFSFVNEDSLTDLFCYNITSQASFSIKNAHLKDVTGMMHLNKQQIITTSLDGTIKIWNFDYENGKLLMDQQKSLQFTNFYNPQNKKMELHFIQKTTWGNKELFCVGTSDSKVLVFTNEQPLGFTEIVVSQSKLKITKIKQISKSNESFQILALALSKDKSYIYRITVDRVNGTKKEQIVQLEKIQGRRINTFQVNQNLLFVSYGNQLIFYQLNSKAKMVGGLLHQNPIKSLTIAECYLRTTALTISVLGVLQGAEDKSEGLLSFYFVR